MDITTHQQAQGFSFPLLKTAEILECMSDLEIPLTESEILEPHRHKEAVRVVFIRLIEMGLGMSEDEIFKPPPHLVKLRDALPYPDLHEDSLGELSFIKASMKLMRACHVRDFGIKDLQAPTSKRFRSHLSGVINFVKYREDQMLIYEELQERRQQVLLTLNNAKQENEMLNEQLKTSKIDNENEWRAMEEVEKDCLEIETQITQQNKLQASIRQENAELKKKANELSEKIATTKLAIQEAQTEERRLASQVVQSPKRIKDELSKVMAAVDREKNEKAGMEHDVQFTKQKIETAVNATVSVAKVTKLMDEIKMEIRRCDDVKKEVRIKKDRIEHRLNKQTELNERSDALEREIHLVEENIANLKKKWAAKREAAEEALHNAQKGLRAVEQERREGMARVEEAEAKVRSIEEEIKEDNKKTDSEISNMIFSYKEWEKNILRGNTEQMEKIACS